MPNINDIIKVTISRQTSAIPQAGFGTALLFSTDTPPDDYPDFMAFEQGDYGAVFADGATKTALDTLFGQINTPEKAIVGFDLGSDASSTAALDRIKLATNDFYCVIPVGDSSSLTDSLKELVSAWAESNEKICFLDTHRTDDLFNATSTADLASKTKDASRTRTAVFYNSEDDESLSCAVAGKILPTLPGAEAFAYQKLSLVTRANLTPTETTILNDKNVNYYDTLANQNITFNGWMSDSGYIDIIRDTDWLVSRLQENVLFQFINQSKIPFSNTGVAIIIQAAQDVLLQAVTQGILDNNSTISRPTVESIPVNERANRKFPNIVIQGRILGAIQSVDFRITITV